MAAAGMVSVMLLARCAMPGAAALREMDEFGFFPGWRDLRAWVESFPARRPRVWPGAR